MRARFVLFVLAVLFVAPVCSTTFAQPQVTKSSEDFLREWAKALCAGELDGITSFYEDSEVVVAIQSTGDVRTGRAEIRREYDSAFREVIFEDVRLEKLQVREGSDVAWATGRFKALTRRKSDSTKWKIDIYTSFVLKRADETWWIVLEQSTPIVGVPRVQRRN